MSELAAPLDGWTRHALRIREISALRSQINQLELQCRQAVTALTVEDTPIGLGSFVGDELALHLAESPGTAQRMVEIAQRFCAFPAVMAQVADGRWGTRHADAVLDEISGIELSPELQQQVVDLLCRQEGARTPHQLRKAARAAIITVDPAAAEHRFERIKRDRHIGSDELPDGAATFWATGTKSQIAMIIASIDALLGPAEPGETRTLAQRRFDILMDLVCGRAVPGQFQALVLISLATLNGEQVPAEIAGLGLITPAEALELLGNATLRRAVVDDQGELVSIDSHVHTPADSTDSTGSTGERRLLTDRTEPDEMADVEPEGPAVSPEDLAWLHSQPDVSPADGQEAAAELDALLAELSSGLERQLQALLSQRTLVPVGAGRDADARLLVEVGHWRHDRPDGPDPGRDGPAAGGGPGPDLGGPPSGALPQADPLLPDANRAPDEDEEPPCFDDLEWHDATLDRAGADARLPRRHYQRESDTSAAADVRPPRAGTAWTLSQLQHALTRMLTAPPDARPLTSTAYTLPPRMARFVKTRDHTCTFPGCYKLAQACQNDHIVSYPAGPTAPDNIASECVHHHQAKTSRFFVVLRHADGTLAWTTRSGLTVHRPPRPMLRGW